MENIPFSTLHEINNKSIYSSMLFTGDNAITFYFVSNVNL